MLLAVELDRTVGLTPNCVLVRRDGREASIEDSAAPIHDRDGHVTGAVIVFRDVGAALETSRQMSHLAQHDLLTGLPNRLLLNDRLTEAIALARRRRKPVAVCYLDVDGFKRSTTRWAMRQATSGCGRSPAGSAARCARRTPYAASAAMNS